jgi:hypothetical protein
MTWQSNVKINMKKLETERKRRKKGRREKGDWEGDGGGRRRGVEGEEERGEEEEERREERGERGRKRRGTMLGQCLHQQKQSHKVVYRMKQVSHCSSRSNIPANLLLLNWSVK